MQWNDRICSASAPYVCGFADRTGCADTSGVDIEFYFGNAIPDGAGANAQLDDGTGFAAGRDGGYDYGWDCAGDTDVDYSGGRRGTGRDGGLGINHFDRNGACVSKPVNWQIAVPNGMYTVEVDFGEDSYTQGCEVEGRLCHAIMSGTGETGSGCIYTDPVTVLDGKFTITGYSHDDRLCHSISKVRIIGGGAQTASEVRGCEGAAVELQCASGTINVVDATYGRRHGPDVCPHSATSNQDCHAAESVSIVSAACEGETACSVQATNGVFGDPCGGTYKYLTVNYRCVGGDTFSSGCGDDPSGDTGAAEPTETTTFSWDDNSGMLGWYTVSKDDHAGYLYVNANMNDNIIGMGPMPFGDRDSAHTPFITRSPTFYSPSAASWIAQGGTGGADSPGDGITSQTIPPAGLDDLTANYQGWALRDQWTGNYVKSAQMPSNQHTWAEFSWDLSEFAGTVDLTDSDYPQWCGASASCTKPAEAGDGDTISVHGAYTFDIIDNTAGGWSHIETQDFKVTAFGTAPAMVGVADAATWHDALGKCESMGMTLASVHSIDEMMLVAKLGQGGWIGLHDGDHENNNFGNSYGWASISDEEGTFAWTDGSDVDFEAWRPGEPNDSGSVDGVAVGEDCVHLKGDGLWNDRPCEDTNGVGRKSVCMEGATASTVQTDSYHWNADSGMMGWTQAGAATNTQMYKHSSDGGEWMGPVPFGVRDNAHELFIVRSPTFVTPVKATWLAQGGKGLADDAGASDSDVSAGFMGWALRAGGGNYLKSTRMSNNQHTWMDFSWDLSVDVGPYSFDIIDNQLGGGWSHIETQDLVVSSKGGIVGAGGSATQSFDYHWNDDSGMLGWTQAGAATDTQKYMHRATAATDGWAP